jgi:HAMP domain-containing protein
MRIEPALSQATPEKRLREGAASMNLRLKIDLTLCGVFVVGLALASAGSYKVLSDDAIADSVRDARIMIESASAIRSYTAESVSPLLQQLMKVQFLPHSIPSFAAQTNFKMVQKKLPEYTYREPTLNPTNVNDRAVDWEADIINDFRSNPTATEAISLRDTPLGKFVTLARPMRVGSQACMTCHDKAENAPATMVALYGTQNGFGWKVGDIVAAQVVSIPLSVPMDRAYKTLLLIVGALAGTFLVILLLVDFLLRQLVVKPVIAISEMASAVSMGDLDAPEYTRDTKDEIGSLAASFNRMRRSLQNAMKMLEAQN